MVASDIVIKGAREHNLREVDVLLPRNALICLTGVSGSGKSSLAFDTLYAEGQRRYVESLSSFARQFLGQMPKPDVDYIGGLSPSISISQKSTGNNPRSTVGTITEIYDYLRVLLARVGQGHCPQCGREITAQTREQILARMLELPEATRIQILAPIIRGQKGGHRDLFEDLLKQGFARARVDGQVVQLADELQLDRRLRHDIEVVIDRLVIKKDIRSRLAEAVELALKMGKGNLVVAVEASPGERRDKPAARPVPSDPDALEPSSESEPGSSRGRRTAKAARLPDGDIIFSLDYACTHCAISFEPPTPQLFSFNSVQGMCLKCDGLGELYSFDPELLVPNPRLSFRDGAIETIGTWKELGRWRRHIYQGLADTMERKLELTPGTLLETPWDELTPDQRDLWLSGAGDEHITFTWRNGQSPMKYGGKFEGVVPDLLSRYRSSKSVPQRRQLERYMRTVPCLGCRGRRLNTQACSVRVTTAHPDFADQASLSLPEICRLPISRAVDFFSALSLDATRALIAEEVLKEIRGRLGFLLNVGLEYLTLDRTAPTLSGGESQRIRLAGQIGSGLVGVLYILDEPSIGLHPRDNGRLLNTLARLRDMGNTVVVVEHDEETMRAADHIIDFGPGPGVRGGEVVAVGTAAEISRQERSVTGQYLSGRLKIEVPETRRLIRPERLRVLGAAHNNLKNIDIEIPIGAFVCITGVSGSGKSSLVNDILVEVLRRDLNKGEGSPGHYDRIEGLEHLDKLIAIDQTPIGRTPRSNPGTYIKVFDEIRDLYTQLSESKRRGFKAGRFSFNVSGGRCEACEGNGSNKLEMDFLADIWVTCPVCQGHRYNRETLQVKFKDKSIAEVLEMDIQQLLELFENIPKVRDRLQTLHDVGLDYLKLGQPSPTLSGGEAQRIKLARELVKKSTGRTLYLLDEPTTGLHFADIRLLLDVLHGFANAGNTVLVVEHNLDVIKTADWLIDLGPEGGDAGGRIVTVGRPEDVAACRDSYTGRALAEVLGGTLGTSRAHAAGPRKASKAGKNSSRPAPQATRLIVQGARQHNLKGVDAEVERDKMTVFCGPSGSGKSSLAMDTIYAEGQRRYVESLSSYARQFVAQMQKPAVDRIEGLSPAIAIEQKNLGHTPRSTVGTVTEIFDYLRILLARLGTPYCPACDLPVGTQTADEIVDKVLAHAEGTQLYLSAPMKVEVGQSYETLWDEIRAAGYARVRLDNRTFSLDEPPTVDRRRQHQLAVLIDRIVVKTASRSRIADSVENALAVGKGVLQITYVRDGVPEERWETVTHSQHLACEKCGRSFDRLSPHNFSFNSHLGWCPSCEGLGTQTGANPTALLRDPKLTLAQGAVALWPGLDQHISRQMLEALGRGTGLPIDVPFEQLGARHRRLIMHGTGEQWFDVPAATAKPVPPAGRAAANSGRPEAPSHEPCWFRFQFKGLYPALEEASKLSPTLRMLLEMFVDEVQCSSCDGSRLRDDAGAVRFQQRTIAELCRLPLGELLAEIRSWKLSKRDRAIAGEVIREIENRAQFLVDVGLDYLSLSRGAATLSNGEAQRIRLASQLGSGLCGVLYVLDEPTIGLHPRDNRRLLGALHKLRDLGNTLLLVEHDREVIEGSDYVCDFGPAAGTHGGQIVARGTPGSLGKFAGSVTGPYLSGRKAIPVPRNRRPVPAHPKRPQAASAEKSPGRALQAGGPGMAVATPPAAAPAATSLTVRGARHNNLRNVDVSIPLGTLTAVTGPSGSGKSSLIDDVLYAATARKLYRASVVPGAHDAIEGLDQINKVIRVDQSALGNSPTSNPATYTEVFELIRVLFAQLPDAKVRGYSPRRFSFNAPGGRCEKCEGNGQLRVEMHFLPDVWVECDTCRGKRYNPETLAVTYHGHSICDVLNMTCGDAARLFENIPKIRRILQTLCDVGLDYVTLGQPAPTLSGGEAQRVKLAAELARQDTGRTLYLLDEPTTGLHFDDLAKLLEVLHRLVDLGNTVVVIEHNLDVIKQADWVIDMGPEAGEAGGTVVVAGTPEDVVAYARTASQFTSGTGKARARKSAAGKPEAGKPAAGGAPPRSYTGEALLPVLEAGPLQERKPHDPNVVNERRASDLEIADVGRDAKMPWETNGRRWHCQDRVGRTGEPCRWDGRILNQLVDRIHELGEFSETNWAERSVVEIAALRKCDGWFLHAITGETWLLKLKFRVGRNTFDRASLLRRIPLLTLNELDSIPLYSNEPRVKVQNVRGPFQEVEIRAHSLEELEATEFWQFVEEAVEAFLRYTENATATIEDHSPWKKLGQKWHFLRKGFPPGAPVQWETQVLEELHELLCECAPDGKFLWSNQQLVHLFVNGQREPWVSLHTKRPQSVDLTLNGPKNKIAFGRVAQLANDREFDATRTDRDLIRLKFRTVDDVHKGDLRGFLTEHLTAATQAGVKTTY